MNYTWHADRTNSRQHWLYTTQQPTAVGLIYKLKPDAYSVYSEGFHKNPFAREFVGVMPTLEEAKDLLLTITASQNI